MRKAALLCFIALLGCSSNSQAVEKTKGEVATKLGKMTNEVRFDKLHLTDSGEVCGYADGHRFSSVKTEDVRTTLMLDDPEIPTDVVDVINRGFLRCVNKGKPVT